VKPEAHLTQALAVGTLYHAGFSVFAAFRLRAFASHSSWLAGSDKKNSQHGACASRECGGGDVVLAVIMLTAE